MSTALIFYGEPIGLTNNPISINDALTNNNVLRDFIDTNYHGDVDITWELTSEFNSTERYFVNRNSGLVNAELAYDRARLEENIGAYLSGQEDKYRTSMFNVHEGSEITVGILLTALSKVSHYEIVILSVVDMFLALRTSQRNDWVSLGNPELHNRPSIQFTYSPYTPEDTITFNRSELVVAPNGNPMFMIAQQKENFLVMNRPFVGGLIRYLSTLDQTAKIDKHFFTFYTFLMMRTSGAFGVSSEWMDLRMKVGIPYEQ